MPNLKDLIDFARGSSALSKLGEAVGVVKPKDAEGRLIDTRRGGPNMPGCQPCSIAGCGLSSKRVQKTRGGANYKCRRHGEFFVRAM
jgi:hypothetical protein